MNNRQILLNVIFKTNCEFASLPVFLSKIEVLIPGLFNGKKDQLLKNSDIAITSLQQELIQADEIGKTEALKLMLLRDLRRITQQIKDTPEITPSEMDLERQKKRFSQIMNRDGLGGTNINLHIVDQLPSPFDKMSWSAFNADEADEKKYGIPRGVYFVRQKIQPFGSTLTLAHEMTHVAIGTSDSNLIGRGLEEGICDIYSFYLFTRLFPADVAKRIIFYKRLQFRPPHLSQLYFDALRQACFLHNRYGMKGIIKLISWGRREIKQVERCLLEDNPGKITLPSGDWDEKVTGITNFIEYHPIVYAISPLAKYIFENTKPGENIEHSLQKLNINKEQGQAALHWLQHNLFLLIVNNGIVTNTDREFLRNTNVLKYTIP